MSITKPNRDWWKNHLARIEKEKIPTKVYADREGLSAQALYKWRNFFKSEQTQDHQQVAVTNSKFLSVTVSSMETSSNAQANRGHCQLTLPGGLRLDMEALPSARWLAELSLDLQRVG